MVSGHRYSDSLPERRGGDGGGQPLRHGLPDQFSHARPPGRMIPSSRLRDQLTAWSGAEAAVRRQVDEPLRGAVVRCLELLGPGGGPTNDHSVVNTARHVLTAARPAAANPRLMPPESLGCRDVTTDAQ